MRNIVSVKVCSALVFRPLVLVQFQYSFSETLVVAAVAGRKSYISVPRSIFLLAVFPARQPDDFVFFKPVVVVLVEAGLHLFVRRLRSIFAECKLLSVYFVDVCTKYMLYPFMVYDLLCVLYIMSMYVCNVWREGWTWALLCYSSCSRDVPSFGGSAPKRAQFCIS